MRFSRALVQLLPPYKSSSDCFLLGRIFLDSHYALILESLEVLGYNILPFLLDIGQGSPTLQTFTLTISSHYFLVHGIANFPASQNSPYTIAECTKLPVLINANPKKFLCFTLNLWIFKLFTLSYKEQTLCKRWFYLTFITVTLGNNSSGNRLLYWKSSDFLLHFTIMSWNIFIIFILFMGASPPQFLFGPLQSWAMCPFMSQL